MGRIHQNKRLKGALSSFFELYTSSGICDLNDASVFSKDHYSIRSETAIIGNQYIIIPWRNRASGGVQLNSYSGFTYKDLGQLTIGGGDEYTNIRMYMATATATTMTWTDTDSRSLFIRFD